MLDCIDLLYRVFVIDLHCLRSFLYLNAVEIANPKAAVLSCVLEGYAKVVNGSIECRLSTIGLFAVFLHCRNMRRGSCFRQKVRVDVE